MEVKCLIILSFTLYMYVQTFRADYIDWCLPLFDSGPTDQNNYTCSFLATQGNMYFVNHTANSWSEDQCCLFGKVKTFQLVVIIL